MKQIGFAIVWMLVVVFCSAPMTAVAQTKPQPEAVPDAPPKRPKPVISGMVKPKNTPEKEAKRKADEAAAKVDKELGHLGYKAEEGTQYNDVYLVYFREYDEFERRCGLSECCRASVMQIRKDLANPDYIAEGKGVECPDNMQRKHMQCPNSYTWCMPKPLPGMKNQKGKGHIKLKDPIDSKELKLKGE